MANPLSVFPVPENETTGPRKHEIVSGKNEMKLALFDRSNVALKKVNSRSATPKKALSFNRFTLPIRPERLLSKQEKSLNLSDIDDDETDGAEPTEFVRTARRPPAEIVDPSEVEVAKVDDDEDQGFDENHVPPIERFHFAPQGYHEDFYHSLPSPDDHYLKMIRKEPDCVDVDEGGYPVLRPLNDSCFDLLGGMTPADEVEYSFTWTDDEVDGRSSGVCDLTDADDYDHDDAN